MPFSKIILIIGLTLVCKAHAVSTNLLSNKYDPEETVKQTEFCHLITDEAIALEVAEKTIELVDSTQCAEDPWSFSKHQSLKTNGSNIVYFIPAVYKPNNHQVHLEFSFWYEDIDSNYQYEGLSCEFTDEAKILLEKYNTPDC